MDLLLSNLHVVLCFIVGTALLITEVFLPGFGGAGIAGVVLEAAAIAMAWFSMGPVAALVVTIVALAVLAVTISFSLHSIAKGKLNSKLVLREQEKAEEGYVPSDDTGVFVGKEGVVTSSLRPTGMADIDGVKLNVMSAGDYIEKGTRVKITSAQGSKIVVEKI